MFIESVAVGSVYLIAVGIAIVLYTSPDNEDETREQTILNGRLTRRTHYD
mgnify:FL=1|tara:strand:- start:388 stop:537 length:150 start_codon:yes stop_codon:yes gene_type:complete